MAGFQQHGSRNAGVFAPGIDRAVAEKAAGGGKMCIRDSVNHEPVNAETLLSGFYEIFSGTSWSHVWYLYIMIGIYLLLPFYHKIASNSTAGELRLSLIHISADWEDLPAFKHIVCTTLTEDIPALFDPNKLLEDKKIGFENIMAAEQNGKKGGLLSSLK